MLSCRVDSMTQYNITEGLFGGRDYVNKRVSKPRERKRLDLAGRKQQFVLEVVMVSLWLLLKSALPAFREKDERILVSQRPRGPEARGNMYCTRWSWSKVWVQTSGFSLRPVYWKSNPPGGDCRILWVLEGTWVLWSGLPGEWLTTQDPN